MQMTDLSFLLYFLPAVLVVYFVLSFSRRAQNLWLVLCSFGFYAFGSMAYTALLLVMALGNYALGFAAQKRCDAGAPIRPVVIATVALNLLPLLFFGYLPPALNTVAGWLGLGPFSFPAVPFGIFFLTLQGISYVADIARGKAQWHPRFTNAALYLVFFPPMAAGPLIRYDEVAGQIEARKTTFDGAAKGLGRLVVGLGKAVLLGSTLMKIADIVFELSNNSGTYSTVPVSLALLGLVSYALGLYHTISGFSDIVIGLGKILGFDYPENFSHPILASSISRFWRRAYNSLSRWFEEYVYRPLGTGRLNNDRMVVHLLVMWLLIGFWTGPGVSRLLFGLLQFLFILLERVIELREHGKESKNPLWHLYVIFIVLISLVALRSDTVYQFTLFISNLFGMRGGGFQSALALSLLQESWPVLALGLIACFPVGTGLRRLAQRRGGVVGRVFYVLYPLAMLAVAVAVLITLSHVSYDPDQLVRLYLWR